METHVSLESNPLNHVDGGPCSTHSAAAAISEEYDASCDNNNESGCDNDEWGEGWGDQAQWSHQQHWTCTLRSHSDGFDAPLSIFSKYTLANDVQLRSGRPRLGRISGASRLDRGCISA